MRKLDTRHWWWIGLVFIALVYLHNTLPHLTMMPRVNVDEPWLIERAYQVLHTGVPSQPMLGLHRAYLLQVGYGYLLAPWLGLFGVGLFQARLFDVLLGLGILVIVASIGRRTVGPFMGLAAAIFLALDSNFLGGVRNARTDIPSVFFVTAALAAYLVGRERPRSAWFVLSGASFGAAMLCHANAFWVGAILLAWFVVDDRRRLLTVPFGYSFLAGLLLTFGPYLAIVLMRWSDVQVQIANFAGDRVPGVSPAFVLHQMARELERYRYWYFGLVTNVVPNPLLWIFKAATIAGTLALAVESFAARPHVIDDGGADLRAGPPVRFADPRGPLRLLILVVGSAFIFAAFINNKVPVYMPHLLIGFSLAAGFAVDEVARVTRMPVLVLLFVASYGAAGIAYYQKWYSSVAKSELVPYEATEATLRTLAPPGPKYVFASPQFWIPFHAESGTTFYSYAAAQPIEAGASVSLTGVRNDRPVYLIVDESQWLPELIGGVSAPTTAWQHDWIRFIERFCQLESYALGTAHGTLALYRCGLDGRPDVMSELIIGGTTGYAGDRVLVQTARDLAQWTRYDDPRRTAGAHPEITLTDDGLRVSGTGWPGIVKMFDAQPGQAYLVRATTRHTRPGDLLYLGTWRQRQLQSLSGASSSGIPAALGVPSWFPGDRAFIATAPQVQVLVYSEAPETDFMITSFEMFRLTPRAIPWSRR